MTHSSCFVFYALNLPAHDAAADRARPYVEQYLAAYFGANWARQGLGRRDLSERNRSSLRHIIEEYREQPIPYNENCVFFVLRGLGLATAPRGRAEQALKYLAAEKIYGTEGGGTWLVTADDWPPTVWTGLRKIFGLPEPDRLWILLTEGLNVVAKLAPEMPKIFGSVLLANLDPATLKEKS